MRKYVLCSVLSLILWSTALVQAQNSLATGITSVLHPSPNAASLGKFTEVPVSLYTGVPSISVPIWQIQRGDIKVDVRLSYHSGGIKVDEVASWVGLGWALSAGGMITCSTRGLPDNPDSYASIEMAQLNRFIGPTNNPMSATERHNYVVNVVSGQVDSEPDLYSLSLGGISCQFFMNKDGVFISTSRELNLKIQYNSFDFHNTKYKWLITDGKGVQYKFQDAEHATTTPYSFDKNGTSNTTGSTFDGDVSWGLNEIEDTQGNLVHFTYAQDGNYFTNITNEYHTIVSASETGQSLCIGKEDWGYTYVDTQGSSLRLASITCGKEEISFVAVPTSRQDLADAHALQRIVVSYAGQPKRAFNFYTSYLSGTSIGTSGIYYPNIHNGFRLQLDSLREESANGQLRKPAYRFTYYAGSLPYRGSAAQDHWGFYNGQDNHTRVGYTLAGQRLGAQKEPSFTYGLIGALATIRYPTGGITSFTYEANQYRRNPADRPLPLDSTLVRVAVDTYDGQDGNSPGDVQGYEAQQTFEVTSAMITAAPGYPARTRLPVRMTTKLLVDGIQPMQQNGFTTGQSIHSVGYITPVSFSFTADSGYVAYLPPGFYTVFVQVEKEFPWQQDHRIIHLEISLSTDLTTSSFAANRVYAGPGLRIKQIRKDSGIDPAEILTYQYKDPTTNSSSGLLGNTPEYDRHKIVNFVGQSVNGDGSIIPYSCGCYNYTSNSHYPLINTRSSYVGYSHVTEYREETGAQGCKAYDYTNFNGYNDLNAVPVFPYPPVTSHETRRGLVMREQTYANAGSGVVSLQRVQTDSTTYDVLPNSLDWAYGVKMANENNMGNLASSQDASVSGDIYNTTITAIYRLEADSFQPLTKTTTQLAQANPWQLVNSYHYTSDTYLPNRITSNTSDGGSIVQRLYYPTDYRTTASNSSLLAGMLAANRITVPLEQNTLRVQGLTTRLTAGTIHEYGLLTAPSGYRRFFLKKIYTAATIGTDTSSHYAGLGVPAYYEEKAQVMKVTESNQPLIEKTKRYQVNSYHWGYENQYAVASCSNAIDTDFFYEGFEESSVAGTSSSGTARAGVKYFLGAYTLNWTPPNNHAYILRYWSRQNGTWIYHQTTYSGPGQTLSGGDAYDEVSVCPQDAQLTTYTYDPLVGMTSQTDPAGRMITYEYDGLGRLLHTRDEQGRILGQQQYHYAGHP